MPGIVFYSDAAFENAGVKTVNIEVIRKGDFFRFPGKKTVYVRGEYSKALKKYESSKFDDISAFIYKKKGTPVEIDFDF